ncbi:DUF4190 domain-containing protein [Agrococcus sp. ARC_14]|uniref:DUF4190 domain-containing protein n=1 Tax=Agrococcus sp. ARC_14 TaxID=2919927 RepID=UPI001F051F8C|nr:DUF4190 domain-containing protein [Agrococcus sp. ARC_14]MCH1882290.1 DUF4190 domain-containing protein [Agrococcus sp. ARC_14]
MTQSPNPATPSAVQPGGYAPAEPKTLSIVSLVLGLASVFLGLTFLVPIAGIVTGAMARKREPAGRTIALWGIWLSIVMLVVGILLWILVGGFILAALGIAAASGA